MDRELWDHCRDVIRRTEAADLGCAVEDFDANALIVVPRPAKVLYPEYPAVVVSFGTGTVVSVESGYLNWVNANRPEKHWAAFNASFISKLGAEVERSGASVAHRSISLAFTIAEPPDAVDVPVGFVVEQHPREWALPLRAAEEFENAVGEANEDDWFDRVAAFFVASDGMGTPLAVASAADDGNGRMEIGLHVARAARGNRLARPVVLAASRWILEQGTVPYYTCGAANVRSHLVAESCGYRALWSVTGIARVTAGVGSQTG